MPWWQGGITACAVLSVLVCLGGDTEADDEPSFSCRKARLWAEKTICHNAGLADLDRRMAHLFEQTQDRTPLEDRRRLTEDQRAWLTDRNACEKAPIPLDCLRFSYEGRLGALAAWDKTPVGDLPVPPVIHSRFRCDDGRDLTVSFYTTEPTRVVIVIGRRTVDLPQAVSGSGARYSDGVTTFWNKGDQARFEWANGSTQCRARH